VTGDINIGRKVDLQPEQMSQGWMRKETAAVSGENKESHEIPVKVLSSILVDM
jgi:hypothetical protein